MEAEILIASSPADGAVSCWDLKAGCERRRYKPCGSPPHGIVSVAGGFASSQFTEGKSSGSIFYWSWNKAQVEVMSRQNEPIGPLVSDVKGTFIVGGGVSGDIYLWEVASKRLLMKWHAHYTAVACLDLYESLLVSGSNDGWIRVWSIYLMLDDELREKAKQPYDLSFQAHFQKVTDVKLCFSTPYPFIVSASEDNMCKIWRLATGELIREIKLPSAVNAISVDPLEEVIYAGARDGNIYVREINAASSSRRGHVKDIIGSSLKQGIGVTCLASSYDGSLLAFGLENGMIRVWDTRASKLVHSLKHTTGPINNVQFITHKTPQNSYESATAFLRKHGSTLPSPSITSPRDSPRIEAAVRLPSSSPQPIEPVCESLRFMMEQIEHHQRRYPKSECTQGVEKLTSSLQQSNQMNQQWNKINEDLYQFCVDQILSHNENNDRP